VKVTIVTDIYALCDHCGNGRKSEDDPILQFGSPVTGAIRLHRKCFDLIAKGVAEIIPTK